MMQRVHDLVIEARCIIGWGSASEFLYFCIAENPALLGCVRFFSGYGLNGWVV